MEGAGRKKNNSPTGLNTKSIGQTGMVAAPAKKPILVLSGNDDNETQILKDLRKEVDALREASKRVKAEGVKDGIEKLSSLLVLLTENKRKRNAENRLSSGQMSSEAILEEVKEEVLDKVMESQGRILEAIGKLMPRESEAVSAVSVDIDEGKKKTVNETNSGKVPSWSEVVGRRRRKNVISEEEVTKEHTVTASSGKKRPLRSRPPAILVDIGQNKYAEMTKKIQDEANMEIIGDSIVGVRQARTGGLLFEVRGDAAKVESVRLEIERSAGDKVEVKTLQNRVLVEVRDLMGSATKEEVVAAISVAVGADRELVRVLTLRKQFGESQAALVLLLPEMADKLLKAGRLLVGLVSCRVRIRDAATKCSRCHVTGHMAKGCSGTDRSRCCWRCGGLGHMAMNCSATRDEAEAYLKVLSMKSSASGEKDVQEATMGTAQAVERQIQQSL